MNPKPLNAGLAERLAKIWKEAECVKHRDVQNFGWWAVAAEFRKVVKEAKGGRK